MESERRECILRETMHKIERRKLDAWEALQTTMKDDCTEQVQTYFRACKSWKRSIKRLMRSFRYTGRGYNRQERQIV